MTLDEVKVTTLDEVTVTGPRSSETGLSVTDVGSVCVVGHVQKSYSRKIHTVGFPVCVARNLSL